MKDAAKFVTMDEKEIKKYIDEIISGKKQPSSNFEKSVVPSLLVNVQLFEKTKTELKQLKALILEKETKLISLDGGINTIINLLVTNKNMELNPEKEKR